MQLEIEINNLTKSPVGKLPIRQIVEATLEKSGYDFLQDKKISLSFAWVDGEEIERLNNLYREKDKPTDVLSFCEYEKVSDLKKSAEEELFLGEIVLCYNYIKASLEEEDAKEDLKKELARVIAHGVLHLLCFQHGKKMFGIQNEIFEIF